MKLAKKFLLFMIITFILSGATAFADEIDFDKNVVQVTGYSAGRKGYQLEKQKGYFYAYDWFYAFQAAQLDALRNMVETICDVEWRVDDNKNITTGVRNDDAKDLITKNARQAGEAEFNDGTNECKVTMELPLFGINSANHALCLMMKNETKQNFPKPMNYVNPTTKYTGLIVDCRGLELSAKIRPVIKNDKNGIIYSRKYLDTEKVYDTVLNHGLVTYTKNIGEQTRAGSNPLIVKAIDIDDDNPVISTADSDKILSANQIDGFLNNAAVVFVY